MAQAQQNEDGEWYVCRRGPAASPGGSGTKTSYDWFLVRPWGKAPGGKVQTDFISFPKELLGTRIRLKVEFVDDDRKKRTKREHILAERIEDFIEENATNPKFRLEKVLDRFGIYPTYANQILRIRYGTNFQQRLFYHRIEKTKELLKNTDKPIKAVAAESGFTYSKYFRKMFSKMVGVDADDYRKNMKKKLTSEN